MARRSGRTRGAVEEPAPAPEEVQEQEPAQESEHESLEDAHDEEEPEIEQGQGADHMPSLQFDEEISWRPGKPIPIANLIKRLEKLSNELAAFEQEETDLDSIRPVAQKLINRNLVQHKDKGVKAYTACCLVDILRLFVPDAPYTNDELKLLFGLFIKDILPALHDPANSYPTQHKYVLMSLTEVKSILLLPELAGSDDLVLRLFNSTFDGVSTSSKSKQGQEVAKDIEIQLTDMLVQLIEEYPGSMPANIIDAIISQFLRVVPPGGSGRREHSGQSTLLHKTEPPAYVMARNICNACDDKMARYVAQYFGDVVLNASKFATDGPPEEGIDEEHETKSGPTDADLKSLRQAHDLMRELWRAAPTVLQNVISLLYSEVAANNPYVRKIGTETIGYMVAGIGGAGPPDTPVLDPTAYPSIKIADGGSDSGVNTSTLTTPYSPHSFAQAHPDAYKEFIRRAKDKVTDIRAAWTTTAGYILATSAGGVGLSRAEEDELVRNFAERICDSEEKVRLAAIHAIQFFDFRDIITKLGAFGGPEKQGSVFYELADRVRDKRTAVRVEATILLGNLWAVGAGELADGQEAVTACLATIPSKIMNVFYANDPELNVLLDRVMHECLVPLKFPNVKSKDPKAKAQGTDKGGLSQAEQDKIRTERILLMLKSLDGAAKKAFFARQAHQAQFRIGLGVFVKNCEAYNGGVANGDANKIKTQLDRTYDWLAQQLPDPPKVRHDLAKLAKLNDRSVYQNIKSAIETESDFQKVRKSISLLVSKLHTMSSVQDTLVTLLYRSAPIMFNRSHLTTIMDYSKNDKDGFAEIAHAVLNDISTQNPDLFKAHAADLRTTIVEHAPSQSKPNEPGVVDMLKAYSSFSKKYPEEVPQDRSFAQTMVSYALYGQPFKTTKYAVNLLMAHNDDRAQVTATNLLKKAMADLKYESPNLLNKLAAVSQLERLAPSVASDYHDAITDLTINTILRQVRTEGDEGPSWVDDAAMDDELQAKCLAMKILVNRALSNAEEEDAEQQVKSLFKLLKTFVIHDGEFCKVKDTPQRHKRRLRLLAAQSILKLCSSKRYDDLFDATSFNKLAEVIQDQELQVRRRFMDKLQSYLARGKLRTRFYTMLFLVAFEPASDVKARVETWLRSRARYYADIKKPVMEALMGRLIPLLAHHPDYSATVEDLEDFAKYILFYLGTVADEENISHIYKYAERVKQTRDALNPENSEPLYILSDLAMTVIRKYQERRGWSFQAWPSKVGLPTGLYAALPSSDIAQEIAKKQYIPEELDTKLDDLLRAQERKKKRKSLHDLSDHPAKKQKQIKAVIREKGGSTPRTKSSKSSKPKKKKASKPRKASPPPLAPSERRRSGRAHVSSNYKERDDDEDEEEMMGGVASWTYDSESGDAESGSEDSSPEASEDETAAAGRSAEKGKPALKASVLRGSGRKAAKSDSDMDVDDEEDEDEDD